jgi:hypothetical protein
MSTKPGDSYWDTKMVSTTVSPHLPDGQTLEPCPLGVPHSSSQHRWCSAQGVTTVARTGFRLSQYTLVLQGRSREEPTAGNEAARDILVECFVLAASIRFRRHAECAPCNRHLWTTADYIQQHDGPLPSYVTLPM